MQGLGKDSSKIPLHHAKTFDPLDIQAIDLEPVFYGL
jgi:hypothetical protein